MAFASVGGYITAPIAREGASRTQICPAMNANKNRTVKRLLALGVPGWTKEETS